MKEKMYRKETRILVSLISTILIFGLYAMYVYTNYIAENPEILNDLKFWGKTFFIFIPIMIVAQIVIHIIFAIINKIITNEDIPSLTDEMDKLIELKSLKISRWVNSGIFFMAMGSLLLGMQIWVMLILMVTSCFLSTIAEAIAQIYFYKKGI
ncbi:MAG TPA: hypothetical protein DCG75_15355 [Bacteroidales bacterium]|jgi:hypothetical protein|nr:hypothetical protein [Bacteroidales bacterium]